MVQTNQEMERELPFFKWCFGLVFRRQDDKGPVVVLEGGGWKLRCESLASLRYFLHGLAERVGDIVQVVTWCRQIKKRRGNYPSCKWCFGLVFRRARASSETPEAASSDVEPGQGQF